MSEGTVHQDGRYWAFISYSHKDAAFGRRLHRRLEAYALPRRLVGRITSQGSVPKRFAPIFRDREELPAAKDLSAEVRAALKESRSLIVVCSPAAAASPWVAEEVKLFHALHPDRPILAANRYGDPRQSLPDVLRHTGPAGQIVEPLAADFRRGHDGWELGLLKLIAGVLGVGLDELVQRDSQRRTQRVTAVTAGALVLMLMMAVLTLFALNAQSEAQRQRAEAEGLVGFMSTDMREKLRGVGRLDLMSAVNARALSYYDGNSEELSPAAEMQRAHIWHGVGEDADAAGHHDMAQTWYERAWRATAALLAQSPDDTERLFAHAQSEFWIGLHYYQLDRMSDARLHFLAYKHYADRLVAAQPHNPRFLRELAYAEGDLCSWLLQPKSKNAPAALQLCLAALAHMKIVARARPPLNGVAADLANRESWLGSAYRAERDNGRALEHWLAQERLLRDLMKNDPLNKDYGSEWIGLQRLLARLDAEAGHADRAIDRLGRATKLLDEMILLDPANKDWAQRRAKLDSDLSKLTHH